MAEDDKKGIADGTVPERAGVSAAPDQTGRVPGAGDHIDPVTAPGDEAGMPGAVRPPEGAGATVAGANDPATEEGDRVTAPDRTLTDESERRAAGADETPSRQVAATRAAASPEGGAARAAEAPDRSAGTSLFDADGPTAAEAGMDGPAPTGETAAGLHAIGVEAGRNPWVLWVMGGAAVIAGLLALAMPLVSSLAASVFVATMLLASGVVGLVTSFRNRDGTDQAMGFALSALSVVAGGVMLLAPLAGIVALSSLIVAFFAASGALKIWYGLKHEDAKGRGWLIAAGALSVVLALVLWTGFPEAALWLPGVLLAVELIMTGTLLIALAVWGRAKIDVPGEARGA